MKRVCKKCAGRSPQKSLFCIHCGARFGVPKCPGCNNDTTFENNFCIHCGVQLRETQFTKDQQRNESEGENKSKEEAEHARKNAERAERDRKQKEDAERARKQYTEIDDRKINEKYYGEILQLKGQISAKDIKANYRKLVRQYHPDKVSALGDKLQLVAEEEMKVINSAYEYFKGKYKIK